ncbi:MAG: SRPBCC family protein [Planctomycetaceae bacterium]|nr:SRPBCC family protein [Planctomycetaceae bacterium]MBV8268889.1 SRPBCC family protein [Planctomycetaceae bacterium]MBV8556456.1 SRPBCC family protein [Planctomycetaceae bacterium]MBV8610241.1 SRPBCC family protein [Singulisphaera sp.]
MHSVRNVIQIRRPVAQVFAFATTPGNWPRWHPASLSVTGAVDHPLEVGEQVTEEFQYGGRRGTVVWTVRRRESPHVWSIDTEAADGTSATITYTLTPGPDGGTTFQRDLVFTALNLQVDWALIGPLVEQQSAEALDRLKAVLEAPEVQA